MTTYSILGATGRIGGQILQHVIQETDINLHLYVRSEKKMLSSQPELENNPRVTIYEGDLDDVDVIQRCIAGTQACFLAVALSENLPNCDIALDTAHVVVEALEQIRRSSSQPLPKLIVLSSSSVSDQFWKDKPRVLHNVIYNANCNIYRDLERAEKFIRARSDWINFTFIKPGGLSDDIRRGYKFSTSQMHTPMSFADLAAAMIEIAGTPGDKWDAKDVSIVPAEDGQGARLDPTMVYSLVKGLAACYLPSLYMYLRDYLP